MGSEMCIRDSERCAAMGRPGGGARRPSGQQLQPAILKLVGVLEFVDQDVACLLYTSDAADERSSVDLGGRRIIKKKKTTTNKDTCRQSYK